MERQLLTRVLHHTGGKQLQAAHILGITRSSVRHKLRVLGITIVRAICAPDAQPDASITSLPQHSCPLSPPCCAGSARL